MEWTESIRKTISYIEKHLLDTENMQNISNKLGISNFYSLLKNTCSHFIQKKSRKEK